MLRDKEEMSGVGDVVMMEEVEAFKPLVNRKRRKKAEARRKA